jgi:hypothetical protein
MTVGGNEATSFVTPILRMNQRFALRKYRKRPVWAHS